MIKAVFPSRREGDTSSDVVALELRGRDGYGSGSFGASRGDRVHSGIDFKAPPDAVILSPVSGKVTKLGYPYNDDLSFKYVEITDSRKRKHRLFYVDPSVSKGDTIKENDPIGSAQHISARYNVHLMNNHIHYEVKTSKGEYLNPERLT